VLSQDISAVACDYTQLPAFVINLDARANRWALTQEEFARLRWPVTRWRAVKYEKSPNKLSVGAAGCLESHRQIWRHALENNYSIVAVFEDDVVFSGDFIDIFPAVRADVPADCDVLHLHCFRASTQVVTPRVVRFLATCWGSHGYLVTAKACEKLLTFPAHMPVDYQLTRQLIQNNGQVYGTSLDCTLCFQRGDDSDIPASAQLAYWRAQRQRYWRPGTAPHEQADVQGSPSTAG
jgi:GR25 family glycosyltransferase involved in LPS biosynthesis